MSGDIRGVHSKIGTQIVVILMITIILPSVFLFLFFVNRYSNDLLDQAISERESLLIEINQSVELLFRDFQDLSMTIYYDDSTRAYIDSHNYTQPPEEVEQTLLTMLNTRLYVQSISMCFGDAVYTYGRDYTNLAQYREKYEDTVLARGGKCVWLPTELMYGAYSRKPKVFAVARAINAPDRQVGVFYMFCSSDFFTKVTSNPLLTQGSSHFYIMSNDGQIIKSDRDEYIANKTYLGFSPEDCTGENGYFTLTDETGDSLVACYARMEETDWLSVIITDEADLFVSANTLKRLTMIVSAFYLLVMIAGYSAIYWFMIRPLGKLSSGMRHVSKGRFNRISEPPGRNEIKQLTQSYNRMVTEIQTLLEEVRTKEIEKNKQRMQVLYMQIGPHFLTNTLNSIKWMAVLNNQTGIKQMVEALMKLTTGVMRNNEDTVTLREEIDVLNSYIYIQRVRFKDFRVEYDVAPDTWELHIGRFMLQPFVENCILHGLRGIQDEGIIRIITRRSDALHIEIHDNGLGFDPMTLEPLKPENRFSDHIGIENVRERIRLYYGPAYGAEVKSAPGQGTVVYLVLPIIEHEEGAQ